MLNNLIVLQNLLPVLALCGGLVLSLRLWQERGQPRSLAFLLLCWASPFVLIGGKAFYLIEHGITPSRAGLLEPGYSLFGAFLMVIAFWGLVSRVRPFPLPLLLDCVTPAAGFALVLYRINCFLAGCCGGIPCTLPWSVRFGRGTPVFANQLEHGLVTPAARFSLPVHPTQLYEALFALAFGFVLLRLFRCRPQDGGVFLVGVLGYTLFRLIVESLRIQTSTQLILGGWSLAQVISLTAAVGAIIGLLKMKSLNADKRG